MKKGLRERSLFFEPDDGRAAVMRSPFPDAACPAFLPLGLSQAGDSPRTPALGYVPRMLTIFLPLLTLAAQPAETMPASPPAPAATSGPSAAAAADTRPYVALTTDLGTITLRLEDKRAPATAANFLRYVDTKRMDGFKFYRATRSWGPDNRLIQAGNRGDAAKNFPPVKHEATTMTGLTNCDGALSMARLHPGDATTDFFLLLSDIKGFDADAVGGDGAGFAVFGEIVGGRDIAEKIFAAPLSPTAGEGAMKGQILDPMVTIRTARRVSAPADAPQGCVVKAAAAEPAPGASAQ